MSYCAVGDLLLGDLEVGTRLSPQAFVDAAGDEMDSILGVTYQIPIDTSSSPTYVGLKLKTINLKLASGRLLMAMDSGSEKTALHAYGASLVNEANADLAAIASGREDLPGVGRVDLDISPDGNGPTILLTDRQSGVDAFYDYVNTPGWVPIPPPMYSPWWRPGPAGGYGPIAGNDQPQPGTRDPDPGGLQH